MDNSSIPSWIWILITLLTNLSAIVIGIISWIKAAKMMPRELKEKDLDLKAKELSMVGQYDIIATKAIKDKSDVQKRLETLERDYLTLQNVIAEQAVLINRQTLSIDSLRDEVKDLTGQLKRVKAYNRALIKQMRDEGIIPVAIKEAVNGVIDEE